jgi:NAD(P)-dependent dehydrogenase (short-subunit alcohol dehydrogenase family)
VKPLAGKVAIVTGAGRGLGEATARLLAEQGASVVVNDLGVALDGAADQSSPAEQVAKDIVATGGTAVADGTNITDFDAVGDLVARTVETHGRLDIVVNVAGIVRDRMIFNMSKDEWDAVIDVHLNGQFNTTRHAASYWRSMKNAGAHYRLINFTSGSGLHGSVGQPNYSAAKMGIVGLTFSTAHALAKYGVTVNAVAPAALTRMTAATPTDKRSTAWEEDEQWQPHNVVPIVGYLASERSAWCTGRVISARGYDVAMYSNPEPVTILRAPQGGWDADALADAVETEFAPYVAANPLRDPVEMAKIVGDVRTIQY